MTRHASDHDNQRRAPRQRAEISTDVTNVMTHERVGQLGDLSTGGLMVISAQPPRADAIYQFSMTLSGKGIRTQSIEVGVQALWHRHAASTGQHWVGYRIIAISDRDAQSLNVWLALPG